MAITVSQTHLVAAPKNIVMESLTDPLVLQHCILQCRTVQRLTPTTMHVTAGLKVLTKDLVLDGLVEFKPLDHEAGFDVKCSVMTGGMKLGTITGDVLIDELPDSTSIVSEFTITPGRKFKPSVEKLAVPLAKGLSSAFFKRFGAYVAEAM